MNNDSKSSTKVVLSALAGNLFVTLIKFIGWLLTRSPSLLAEALHSLADTFNQFLLLLGIRNSQGERSGPVQFLYNFSSAIFIFILGGVITIAHAVHDLFYPSDMQDNINLFYISLGIIAVSFIVEGYTCVVALKAINAQKGKKSLYKFLMESNNTTLVGIFLEDSAALLGLVLALVGMCSSRLIGSNIPDAVAALMIGLMMGFIAILLLINNSKLLIGKSLDKETEDEIKDLIESTFLVDKVVEMSTEIIGLNRVNLYCSVEVNGAALISHEDVKDDIAEIKEDLAEGESLAPVIVDIVDRTVRKLGNKIKILEEQIKKEYPEIKTIDIEVR